jgi:hypothetical protein
MQPDYKVALVTGISFMLLRYGSLDLETGTTKTEGGICRGKAFND